nr:O-antigen ligase family protein [Polymorphobacter fuscus]
MIVVMYLTNARSAMVGLLAASILYLLFVSMRQRTLNKQSIFGTGMVLAYPAAVAVLAVLVNFWPRLHVMVLGGGQHQASSDARKVQWAMGWPKIFSHPFGYGVSRSGEALGYYNLAGEITVDSHYLSMMLDSGILALPLFLMCFFIPAWLCFVNYSNARTPEQELLAPLALGLINFTIVKMVLTSEGSVPLAFIMSGCAMGLIWQRSHAKAAAGVVDAPAGSRALPPPHMAPALTYRG